MVSSTESIRQKVPLRSLGITFRTRDGMSSRNLTLTVRSSRSSSSSAVILQFLYLADPFQQTKAILRMTTNQLLGTTRGRRLLRVRIIREKLLRIASQRIKMDWQSSRSGRIRHSQREHGLVEREVLFVSGHLVWVDVCVRMRSSERWWRMPFAGLWEGARAG